MLRNQNVKGLAFLNLRDKLGKLEKVHSDPTLPMLTFTPVFDYLLPCITRLWTSELKMNVEL